MKVLYSRYLPPFIPLGNQNNFLSVLLSNAAKAPSERFFVLMWTIVPTLSLALPSKTQKDHEDLILHSLLI